MDVSLDRIPPTEIQLARRVPADDVTSTKDQGRNLILWGLSIAFIVTVIGGFVGAMLASGHDWSNIKELLDLLLPAETALLGVAVAFYMTD